MHRIETQSKSCFHLSGVPDITRSSALRHVVLTYTRACNKHYFKRRLVTSEQQPVEMRCCLLKCWAHDLTFDNWHYSVTGF